MQELTSTHAASRAARPLAAPQWAVRTLWTCTGALLARAVITDHSLISAVGRVCRLRMACSQWMWVLEGGTAVFSSISGQEQVCIRDWGFATTASRA